MIRGASLAILGVLGLAGVAAAQSAAPAARFRWQAGQVLSYRVEQTTTAGETVGADTTESVTKMALLKRWQVLEVDAAGVATLQMSLAALRVETRKPDGQTVVFDSATPDPANAELAQYVGPPLAVLRIDSQGRLVEVRESKFGPASRFECELPFKLTLPDAAPAAGQAWQRDYKIKLDPPLGVGETYDAAQTYACKSADAVQVVVALTTALKSPPPAAADGIPLLPMQPEGEVVFDAAAGRFRSARLKVEKEIANHRGEGSKYRFASTYSEELVEAK
jgi:hypothetical protein